MADLSTFCVAPFSQGANLRRTYEFNKELHGGICFALMCQWVKRLKSAPDEVAGDRMDAMDKAFRLAGGRQRIYTDFFSKTKMNTWQDVANMMTQQGRLFGISFAYEAKRTKDQFKTLLSDQGQTNKFFYLSIKFLTGGGHAIGFYTSNPIKCFDPNFGEHEIRTGKRSSFLTALWSKYAPLNGGINNAYVYEMTSQESLFAMWEQKTKTL